jgi:hypothetical protein
MSRKDELLSDIATALAVAMKRTAYERVTVELTPNGHLITYETLAATEQ